jgi:hypothetical protein
MLTLGIRTEVIEADLAVILDEHTAFRVLT